jgi:hypothetical protein
MAEGTNNYGSAWFRRYEEKEARGRERTDEEWAEIVRQAVRRALREFNDA